MCGASWFGCVLQGGGGGGGVYNSLIFPSWRIFIVAWDMTETLAKKTAKPKALHYPFERLALQEESCLENLETPWAKILALKISLEEVSFNLKELKIFNLCDEDKVKKES